MKVLSVVGARPQFIKAAPVSRVLRQEHSEILVHTGQHYDEEMSAIFFRELSIPEPDYNLGVGSGSHGWQTAQMLIRLEDVLLTERPDRVLIYGDTNSTLAGALAAVKLGIPVAHVEAGLRSFNREMPEEHNRVIADHCADVLCCPTETALSNLAREGLVEGVHLTGDTMCDALRAFSAVAAERSRMLAVLDLAPGQYLLATIHRPYNTDVPANLQTVLAALGTLSEPVVLPVHPRTRVRLGEVGPAPPNVRLVEPVGYLDMLMLERHARWILTDSGGIQKEAYLLQVPCVTVRPETEWVETVASGWNRLAWGSVESIVTAIRRPWPTDPPPPLFGDGHAAERVVKVLG